MFARIQAQRKPTQARTHKQMVKPVEIIILAAGKGTRMRSELPKVLHQVAGKTLLQHVLDAAQAVNPSKVHVVIGHGREAVQASIDAQQVNWVEQLEQNGTGHAVMQALPFVADESNVLLLTADVPLINPETLAALVEQMTAFPLALLTALVDDPFGLGRIMREGDSVVGIVEEKDCDAEQRMIGEINSGIMCARATELKKWLAAVGDDNAQGEYYLTDIVEIAFQHGNPIAALHPQDNAEVEGINSRSQLAKVERAYQRQQAERLMAEGVTLIDPARIDIRGEVEIGQDTIIDINTVIIGPTKIGRGVNIAPNCVISDSNIGDGSNIHANSVVEQTSIGESVNVGPFARLRPGTELGDEVRIGNFVETKNAKLATGAKANHLSYVGDATVGANTNIGAGVITCNYDGANKHQTKIGSDVFVGSDSQLVAPVEIAEGATIGAGSTITANVDKNQLAISRGRQRQINNWQRPKKETK